MKKDGAPQLLVPPEPRFRALREGLSSLLAPNPSPGSPAFGELPDELAKPEPWQRPRAFFSSTLLHIGVLLFLVSVPFSWLFSKPTGRTRPVIIVYNLSAANLADYLPALRARGPGGRPGRGIHPDKLPALGSTAFHPKVTLISNPPRPDNNRQTIIQPASPPELKITAELRLPNIIIGSNIPAPKRPTTFRLTAPARAVRKPNNQELLRAPTVSQSHSDLALIPSPFDQYPRLPVPPPPPPASPAAPVAADAKENASFGSREGAPGDQAGLVVLSVDPTGLKDMVALPPGNRYGAFSISPAGGQPGSPGGVPGGDPLGGTGGPGTGGDMSTGVGSGSSGGGGGGTAGNGIVSITGTSGPGGVGGAIPTGVLSQAVIASLVYPVVSPPHLRQGSLTVMTGPIGGGGLRVYGVLRGGKVFTVFLRMPKKNWVLQYCQRGNPERKIPEQVSGVVVQLDRGIVPPYAEKQFDFHRVPVPEDKAKEMIILRGIIQEDGSVGHLKIYQGIQPLADQAAMAAFSRWKFKPALRGGKPIAVDILVGIPATVPGS